VNLRRSAGRPLVIGHRGAAAVAPENTLAALAAGIAAGADLVEFDVGADLMLAHSASEAPDEPATLAEALELIRASGAGAHVDLKARGIETRVAAALRQHGLAERSVVSAVWTQAIRASRAAEPGLSGAITYPHDRHGVSSFRWPQVLVAAGAGSLRAVMPARLPFLLRRARADAISLHHALVSRAAVTTAHALGAAVIAWTVNDPEVVRRLAALGVDGIVSDDPAMALRALGH
jgi:glycerophosphoryl diester phosphodiesterase